MNGWIDYRTQYVEWMDERMIDTSSLLRHRGWGAAAAAAGEFAEVSRSIAWEFVVAVGGVVDSCPMNLCLCLSLRALSPPSPISCISENLAALQISVSNSR
jgi:hypothetical protein